MFNSDFVLTVNSSFPEMEHLAASLAEIGLLSCHVRPYINKGRKWEQTLKNAPLLGNVYNRTFGRRKLCPGLPENLVKECAVSIDLLMAAAIRIPLNNRHIRSFNSALLEVLTKSISSSGVKAFNGEIVAVASWGVAELLFQRIKNNGGINILNYSFAHHAFAKNFLLEEAEREPAFAGTLKQCDFPSWLIDRLEKEIELSDKILVGSSFVKNTFLEQHVTNDKLLVLPYGVDTNFFTPSLSPPTSNNRFRVLFVGQIGQRKGISYLLRAYKRFRRPETSLTLVGRIRGDDLIFSPWRHLFEHINHCPKKDLLKIFQNSHVFLFPTLLEGMPLVILEAMACGLPVVTTANGPCDIIRDGVDGFIVPPRDADAIILCLEKLINDPELRDWMGSNARRRALQFSWKSYRKKIANQLILLHEQHLGKQ